MKHILVPTDFSEDARNAAYYAAHFAEKLQCTITLLHAYMLPTPVSEVPYVMINAEELQKENEEIARGEADKLTTGFHITANYIVHLGFPSDEIENVAEENEADLVVMGMKGKGTLEKIVGSTTTSTLKKIKKPLLIIPEKATYHDIRQVTYATDFSYSVNAAIYQPLLELLKSYEARLNIVHVKKNAENKSPELAGEQQLDPIFQGIPHEYHVITDTDVKHGIESYLNEHPTDLLVMITHEHSFWERIFGKSHTRQMVYHTHTPLLVLKDKK